MDQKKIGMFLAQLRKENGMTQNELAETLGTTNKTISRWETGKYMPDLAMIPLLCNVLSISINEFLAGEHLEEAAFRQQADQNIVHILNREAKYIQKKKIWAALSGAGTGMLISSIYSPASTVRTVIIIAAVLMINISWLIENKLFESLIEENKKPTS